MNISKNKKEIFKKNRGLTGWTRAARPDGLSLFPAPAVEEEKWFPQAAL